MYWYVSVGYSSVTRLLLVCICMLRVCIRMLLVCTRVVFKSPSNLRSGVFFWGEKGAKIQGYREGGYDRRLVTIVPAQLMTTMSQC